MAGPERTAIAATVIAAIQRAETMCRTVAQVHQRTSVL
ncbi:MAG: hypothetical protein ACI8TX_004012 [Hyphomicrobiaceae bacterium]